MIEQLQHRAFSELSPRCQEVIGEIYAKLAGRMGSKAYNAALDEFERRTAA